MKLKVLPILIALLTSGTLLFGGWFMYRSYAMENPLADLVKKNAGVEQVDATFSNKQVVVNLKLTDGANLRHLYQSIVTDGASLVDGREVKLQIDSQSSDAIDDWWSKALFGVAQAMDNKQYSDIPKLLNEQAQSVPSLQASTEMDSENVYIRLSDGKNSKYVILPRVPASVGVWPNE
ncbi:hypothetical protein [Gorillibacterium timonense]|uniref:hypothetical protein n=1 Tax=Gorillibacterium timonense TaxID=1689269 RepID=UPI00071E0414|nr:hypothetical protein [Gorillibacterium timonense]